MQDPTIIRFTMKFDVAPEHSERVQQALEDLAESFDGSLSRTEFSEGSGGFQRRLRSKKLR
jgi:hypothetical protein